MILLRSFVENAPLLCMAFGSAIVVAMTHSSKLFSNVIARLIDSPILNTGSIIVWVIILGNGATSNADTNASFNRCLPKSFAIFHVFSFNPLKKLSTIFHVNQIALRITANGIIICPSALYNFGNILDNSVNIPEKISHVQHVEKNSNESETLTGEKCWYVAPKMDAPAVMPSIHNSGTALAPKGKNDKNIIKNFFNGLIVFNYTIFCNKCDIIERIK